jgi:hypothetical protein
MRDSLIILGDLDLLYPVPSMWNRHVRNLAIAVAASLLVHAFVLFYHFAHRPMKLKPLVHLGGPLSVELVPLRPARRAGKPPKAARPSLEQVPHPLRRRVIAVKKAAPAASMSMPAPKMSFLDYVNKARERRDAAQDEYPVAPLPVGPFPQQGTHPKGTSGLFRIIRMNDDTAEISFLGWHSEYSNAHREVFEVEAGPDGDIKIAIVRKIIEIIRRYYDGDFNWESDRLGGQVVLSARPKDNAQLESFLMKEFFGP